jgi:hypothetical protein
MSREQLGFERTALSITDNNKVVPFLHTGTQT